MSEFWNDKINLDAGPYKVLIKRDQFIDVARDSRVVKIKVYYPSDYATTGENLSENDLAVPTPLKSKADLPVIIWSHGLGGSVDGASFLSRYVASYGYVIVHVQHHGTDSSLWEGKEGHPWDIIRKTKISRETTFDRYHDIPFALDHLSAWMAKNEEVGDIADLTNMGMSGHSFGALTTQVMAGMKFPDKFGTLQSFKEPRFKAGILYSPGSVEHLDDPDPKDVYPSIDIPLFHMTGTDDGSPISDRDYTMRLAPYEHTTQAEKYLLVLKDGDHMVYNGSRGKLGQNPNREKHENIIKIAALVFWDAQLKADARAQDWLNDDGFKTWLSDEGEFS